MDPISNHFCLSASLARLEARIALEALLDELPRRERSELRVEHIDSFLIRRVAGRASLVAGQGYRPGTSVTKLAYTMPPPDPRIDLCPLLQAAPAVGHFALEARSATLPSPPV